MIKAACTANASSPNISERDSDHNSVGDLNTMFQPLGIYMRSMAMVLPFGVRLRAGCSLENTMMGSPKVAGSIQIQNFLSRLSRV